MSDIPLKDEGEAVGKARSCRACGAAFDYPAPASRATKRFCESCAALPEGVRRVLEVHQLEIFRLKRALAKVKGDTEGS